MTKIERIETQSQEILAVFDFTTRFRHLYITFHNRLIEAINNKIPFDPIQIFPFLEELTDPERTINDLVLDCYWKGPETLNMEITDELMGMLPLVDTERVKFSIRGRKKTQGELIFLPDISFITVVYQTVDEPILGIKNDQLFVAWPKPRTDFEFPTGYTPHGHLKKSKDTTYKTEPTKPQPEPKPKTKAKVIRFPKYYAPTKDVVEYCKKIYGRGEWRKILKALHRYARYRKRRTDKFYPGKSERKNRQYVYGQEFLARKCGLTRRNIRKWLYRFEDDGVIYYPYVGFRGRGASICELAFCVGHMKVNKRNTRARKKRSSIRWPH